MHVESEPATSTLEPMAYRNSLKTSDLLFAPKSVIQNGKADNSVAGDFLFMVYFFVCMPF